MTQVLSRSWLYGKPVVSQAKAAFVSYVPFSGFPLVRSRAEPGFIDPALVERARKGLIRLELPAR